jgi:hypothetical protein
MQSVFELAKKNYGRTWTIDMLQNLVGKGKLSVDEYVTITQSSAEDLIPSLELIKERKIAELSGACEANIVVGIDVDTTMGVEHFSLEITDQIEITNQFNEVLAGATQVLYHADGAGGNCRLFTAQEMTDIAIAVKSHVTYHKTYFNELKAWVNRCATVEAVTAIAYGASLPEDLDNHLVSLVGKSSIN